MQKTKVPLERSLAQTALRRLKRIRASDPTLAFRNRHGSVFGAAGDPDLYGVWRKIPFEIELKQPGRQPTRLQAARLLEWENAGALTFVVHSPEELSAALAALRQAALRLAE